MFNDLLSELEKPSEPIQTFGVELLVNSRQDIDNLVIMNKWFVDTLREEQWVADDNQSHFRKFVIKVNNDQKKDLYVLRLFEI
jgi:Holliday junction resolvase RusA-like endonuclease